MTDSNPLAYLKNLKLSVSSCYYPIDSMVLTPVDSEGGSIGSGISMSSETGEYTLPVNAYNNTNVKYELVIQRDLNVEESDSDCLNSNFGDFSTMSLYVDSIEFSSSDSSELIKSEDLGNTYYFYETAIL